MICSNAECGYVGDPVQATARIRAGTALLGALIGGCMAPAVWIVVFLVGLVIIPLGLISRDGYNTIFIWVIVASFLLIPLGILIGASLRSPECPVCGSSMHDLNSAEGRRALAARERYRNSGPP